MSNVKIQPQATDLEEAVLGALMLEKDAFVKISDKLKAEMFYKKSHSDVYDAISNLSAKGNPIDLLTVAQELRAKGKLDSVGGAFGLTEITNRVASAANIEAHAAVIYSKYVQRELIRISANTANKAYQDSTNPFDLIQEMQAESHNLIKETLGRSAVKASKLIPERIKEYQKPSVNGLTGISSGLASLDAATGGFQKSDLVIIAGRPGMGKTAFVLNLIAKAALSENKPVGVFSLEMSREQLIDRVLCLQLLISGLKMKSKSLDEEDYHKIQIEGGKQEYNNIIIDDSPGLNFQQLRAKSIRMQQTDKIEMLVIDYLGLIKPEKRGNGNRTNEIGEISRNLKGLAKELNIPVLVLSQLNRSVEDRPDKKPRLSDLRDSGDIEQDADVAMFLYRPEYYGITQDNQGATENKCYLMIEKNRNGVQDNISCYVDFEFMKFSDTEIKKYPF